MVHSGCFGLEGASGAGFATIRLGRRRNVAVRIGGLCRRRSATDWVASPPAAFSQACRQSQQRPRRECCPARGRGCCPQRGRGCCPQRRQGCCPPWKRVCCPARGRRCCPPRRSRSGQCGLPRPDHIVVVILEN